MLSLLLLMDLERGRDVLPAPAATLAGQCVRLLLKLPFWKQLVIVAFMVTMLLSPLVTTRLNIRLIKGTDNLATVFIVVKMSSAVVEALQGLFLKHLGCLFKTQMLTEEVHRYSKLSKQTAYKYPASKTLEKDLDDAVDAVECMIQWGLDSTIYTIGTILSCAFIFISDGVSRRDLAIIGFVISSYVFFFRIIQQRLNDSVSAYRNTRSRTRNLISLLSAELQNKECTPEEYAQVLTAPYSHNERTALMYSANYNLLKGTILLLMLMYSYVSPNDSTFMVKYILLNSISGAVNGVSQFFTQYTRYCNEYESYYAMFRDESLEYDEYVAPEPLPEVLNISDVSIRRGTYEIHSTTAIQLVQGSNILVRGPSGSGKSSFVDALLGYISGISLHNGVQVRAYSHQFVVHLQNAMLMTLTNVSLYDVFRPMQRCPEVRHMITECLLYFFTQKELDRILENIADGKQVDSLGEFIQGRLSGGQKMRVFLAVALFRVLQKRARVLILDEPEQGLDPKLQITCFRAISRFSQHHNLTVIWVTHLHEGALKETEIEFESRLVFDETGNIGVH